ncbi:DEAD/DEAH box helicase family protein [Stagnihabitans tardus]|uniref:Helicase n=1 Tax=Stagnihabitans tardus TaxID=2699202 RepID=A0AAE5BW82_9RHOB|nr:DEAD/DEAH box helicase family protein [Stagnihabitans tardus]NBZ89002.1 helicase [Stagnihabitans tardus]
MDWMKAADYLEQLASQQTDEPLDAGQRASVAQLAARIRSGQRAALLADEVGMGKTRIAVALISSVRKAGGRAAIVLPAGLGVQWQKELRLFHPDDQTLLPLRSYDGFIAGFLTEEDAEGNEKHKRKHKDWLRNRRQQRELPQKGWDDEEVLMISHTFAAMRFPNPSDGPAGGWRRELLPNVARLLAGQRRNFMRNSFHRGEVSQVHATRRAARTIANTIIEHGLCRSVLDDLVGDHRWLAADEYKRKILPLIGYGLGRFDLIVVDEAHKARGEDSSLSRILGPVSWESDDPFRLGMTATPVELDSAQWIDTLGRISGQDDGEDITPLAELAAWISGYVDIVKRIQVEELDEPLTDSFENAATRFQKALRPYVLRRDKRHDPQIRAFQEAHGDYRVVEDLKVSPTTEGFTRDWLRRFCAAEALSILPQDDHRVKRARLSVAQAYGFGLALESETAEQLQQIDELEGPQSFWFDAFRGQPADIYTHPAILAAVRLIESYAKLNEKVLVFGRFIAPMNALTRLLDAREMLRRLRDGRHWPASKIRDESEPAVLAAMKDPDLRMTTGGITAINQILTERYRKWSSARRTELARLHREIEGLAPMDDTAALLVGYLRQDDDGEELQGEIGALLEALGDRRKSADAPWSGDEMLSLFKWLLDELSTDEEQENESLLQSRLASYLQDFSGREGNFARMMSGATQPQTRRLLQSAFNRASTWPMVLLAQSRVGREGLNLHEACRTVVILHAEWNPGIVEQQIGRVDRKGSRWLKDLEEWYGHANGDPPRICIHPVVVSGTYDDHNWQVLKARWMELRAQLHGEVLPHQGTHVPVSAELKAFRNRIIAATPTFAPWEFLEGP